MADVAFYLSAASAISILFSIAVSQILLALGVVALLLSGVARVRFPPILLPLGLFMAGTLISLLLSADPAAGRPQARKFFVFLIIMVVYSTARTLARVRGIILVSTAIVSFSAVWRFRSIRGQVAARPALSDARFTPTTPSERITGFMSHWMTLGGQEMIVVLMAAALLFFSFERRWKPWLVPAVGVILARWLSALPAASGWGPLQEASTCCGSGAVGGCSQYRFFSRC